MSEQAAQPTPVEFIPLTDDQQLAYTQQIRRGFIDHAVKTNVLLTGEKGDKALVLQTLDSMDRSALTNKRIKAEEKSGELNANAAVAVAHLLSRMDSKSMREEQPVARKAPPLLPDSVPPPELAIGEIETAATPMNYKSFMAEQNRRMGNVVEED